MAISRVTGIPQSVALTIFILISICCIYTFCVYLGMKGVQLAASCCVYLFFMLLAYVFFLGGESRYIIETGLSSIGNLVQNFIGCPPGQMPCAPRSFLRTGPSFTGPTGLYGV